MSCSSCSGIGGGSNSAIMNNNLVRALPPSINVDVFQPRLKATSSWANYKNAKSGNYNRQGCWACSNLKGFPQEPGVYDLNIVNQPPYLPTLPQGYSQEYQQRRMSNNPGSCNGGHMNYLNDQCGYLYPQQYIKGNWPDEQLIYTNVPKNVRDA